MIPSSRILPSSLDMDGRETFRNSASSSRFKGSVNVDFPLISHCSIRYLLSLPAMLLMDR